MESPGLSWADQWDYNTDVHPSTGQEAAEQSARTRCSKNHSSPQGPNSRSNTPANSQLTLKHQPHFYKQQPSHTRPGEPNGGDHPNRKRLDLHPLPYQTATSGTETTGTDILDTRPE
ncbi:hypothetical protein QQ045_001860 [Rhodiola kirilowii]